MSDRDLVSFNLAARAARWSAGHWKTTLFSWIAFCVVAVALGSVAGTRMLKDADTAAGETKTAETMLRDAGFPEPRGRERARGVEGGDAVGPAVSGPRWTDVDRTVSALPNVQNVRSPLAPGNGGQVSSDRHSALVQFEIGGDEEKADDKIQPILDAVGKVQDRHDGFTVAEFGFASANHELNDTLNKDFQRAEYSSLPVALIILLIVFGALVAAGLPVLLAFSGVLATIGLSAAASHVVAAGDATKSVILLIGMAVGVGYSLFYLRREREERARGLSPKDALLKTARASGHAILISGMTVLIAMAEMLFTGNAVFTSIAVGAMLMVAVALIGSLSILPAMLGKLEHRVDKGRIPFLGRNPGRESRIWGFVLDGVMRRPAVAAVLSGAALVALAVPALTLPRSCQLHRPAEVAADRPHLRVDPAGVPRGAVSGEGGRGRPRRDRASRAAGDRRLKQRALASGQMFEPISTEVNPDKTVETVSIAMRGNGSNGASVKALETLRKRVIPSTLGTVTGVEGGRDRGDGGNARLQRADEVAMRRSCSRRAPALLPAAAGHVPVDRDPGEGRVAQPALRGRGLRPAGARLPAPLGGGDPRLPLERRNHLVAAAVHVRDPVRPLDGLPRLHPQPGEGAGRRGDAAERGGWSGSSGPPPR